MDRYASRLAFHLKTLATDLEIALAGEIGDLTVEHPGSDAGKIASNPTPFPLLPTPGLGETRRYLARYWTYPLRIKWMHADLVHILDHSYAHILLSRRKTKSVVTVHDLLPVMEAQRVGPGLKDRIRGRLLQRVLAGLRSADAWITPTEWLRGELARWLGGEDGRIHVIPFGVDDAFFEPPPAARATTRQRLRIPDPAFVVLHVGSVGPRKNLPAVMAAVRALREIGMDAWLLQVGGRFTAEQERDLVSYGIAGCTRQMPDAKEVDLRAAYRAADVLLFPSHYEGFGYPLLEAMASGLPVVTSGAGGLAEVAGDAAVVVGGRETAPYVQAVRRLAQNPAWREQLIPRGVERARRFRWVETARRTAELYRSLLAGDKK
jgi:glycosyltransferase involved in cell wall biosynthesis